ncbi:hypothetical protein M5G07_00725 [Serratia symbiotica]|nr:hypothetical protein [Serratia symbiotica]
MAIAARQRADRFKMATGYAEALAVSIELAIQRLLVAHAVNSGECGSAAVSSPTVAGCIRCAALLGHAQLILRAIFQTAL